jgi:hypothetical protein
MNFESLRTLSAALALGGLVGSAIAAPLPIYDDFSSTTGIDRSKWNEGEALRYITAAGRLVLGKSVFGGTSSDSGSFVERQALNATLNAPATTLKASITVTDVNANETCAGNPAVGNAQARIVGILFNARAGGPLGGGNREGDVFALVRLGRSANSIDPVGVLQVQGLLAACSNADCSTVFSGAQTVNLGTTTVGTRVVAQIAWNKAKKTISYSRDNQAPMSVTYDLDDSVAPSVPLNNVSLQTSAPNCSSGPRVKSGIVAWFDNVSIVP